MELEIGLALSVLGGLLGVLSFVQSRDKSVEKDRAAFQRPVRHYPMGMDCSDPFARCLYQFWKWKRCPVTSG